MGAPKKFGTKLIEVHMEEQIDYSRLSGFKNKNKLFLKKLTWPQGLLVAWLQTHS